MNAPSSPQQRPLYARFWSGGVQPFFERYVRGKQTPQIERALAQSQWLPWPELEQCRWRDMSALLEHACRHVPFYRDWFAAERVSPADIVQQRALQRLPLVTRDMMMAQPERFRSENPPPGSYHKTTGGTTGAPLEFFVSPLSDHWRNAVSRRGYAWAGCVPGRKQVHIWSADILPLPPLKRWKKNLHRAIMRQRFINSYKLLRSEDFQGVLVAINRFGPDCIVGYPSSTAQLARFMAETNQALRKPPVSFLAAGEALFPYQRDLIEKVFGCRAFETYGNREFMLMASECEAHSGLHVTAENVILELLANGQPTPPGLTGEIVVTDLHNFAFPFIRYRTGDLSAWTGTACPCGRAAPLLTRIEGRELDMLRAPNGATLSGHFIPHFIQSLTSIDRFQVAQDRLDRVVVRVVPRGQLKDEDRRLIVELIERALPGITVLVETVAAIELTKSGKHRTTVSHLPPSQL